MARLTDTRARMVRTAADLLRRQGYAATGWRQIVSVSLTPWGSQAHHFPGGKEQIATEALALAGQRYEALLRATFTDVHPAEAVLAWSRYAARALEASDWADGCPVATVALETSHTSEPLALACSSAFAAWSTTLTDALAQRGVPRAEAGRLATLVLSAVEGALLLARARRSAAPLRVVGRELAVLLRARVPAPPR